MATVADIQATIDALEQAKIDLATGKMTVTILFDGRSKTFAKTDLATINGLIAEQRMKLAQFGAGPVPRRGFMVQF